MSKPRALFVGGVTAGIAAILLAACGGGNATPTPQPTATKAAPTATPAPSPTPAPAPTPTRAPTAPSATPVAAAPTATPAAGAIPSPVVKPATKRGGTLQSRSLSQARLWDSFEIAGFSEVHTLAPMLNNLIQLDPYSDTHPLVGDLAERWEFTQGGQVLTFFLRRGIKFHDGMPFTSKDVAYNFDRGWKPRTPTMTFFAARFKAISRIETPDDFTVRLTLSVPSNILLQATSMTSFQMYPAHFPFPGKLDDFKKTPVGTGPFRFKSFTLSVDHQYVRSGDYWKPGLPYLDGHTLIQLTPDAALAAFRTGRLDVTNLDTGVTDPHVDTLRRDAGFTWTPVAISPQGLRFQQKAPFTDARVREAVDLAIDRGAVYAGFLDNKRGTPFGSPMLPPEMGGKWGISTEVMKTRPGFRPDKTADLARAKQLITQAGIDPGSFTLNILANDQIGIMVELLEPAFRALGFKTKMEALPSGAFTQRLIDGGYDVSQATASQQLDDPLDQLSAWAMTGGPNNYSKWSNPKLDDLFTQQDQTLDAARRRQLILDLQEQFLQDRHTLVIVWRTGFVGSGPGVRNFPAGLPFLFSPHFRHEQVWLDR